MAAVGNGFVDCANLLLSEGANMLALDMYHRSALHRAVSSSKNFHRITFLTTFLRNSFVKKFPKPPIRIAGGFSLLTSAKVDCLN